MKRRILVGSLSSLSFAIQTTQIDCSQFTSCGAQFKLNVHKSNIKKALLCVPAWSVNRSRCFNFSANSIQIEPLLPGCKYLLSSLFGLIYIGSVEHLVFFASLQILPSAQSINLQKITQPIFLMILWTKGYFNNTHV